MGIHDLCFFVVLFLSFWQWLSDAINATHHRSRGNFFPGAPRRHLRLLAAAGGSSLAKLDVVVGVVSGKIVTKAYPLVNDMENHYV